MPAPIAETTYVLPIRRTAVQPDDDLARYLATLASLLPVVVVDGSPPDVFAHHAASWPSTVAHLPVDADRLGDLNGKVAGVVTGLRRVHTAKAVLADDDVRWDAFSLRRLAAALDHADVVRPQNVFAPLPWHALLDSGRSLIARATGGDWPGTLGAAHGRLRPGRRLRRRRPLREPGAGAHAARARRARAGGLRPLRAAPAAGHAALLPPAGPPGVRRVRPARPLRRAAGAGARAAAGPAPRAAAHAGRVRARLDRLGGARPPARRGTAAFRPAGRRRARRPGCSSAR